jgi:hypothetical protein
MCYYTKGFKRSQYLSHIAAVAQVFRPPAFTSIWTDLHFPYGFPYSLPLAITARVVHFEPFATHYQMDTTNPTVS